MIKRILIHLWLLLKYPNKLREAIVKFLTLHKARKLGIQTCLPNFIYLDRLSKNSKVLDIGCGYKAEFSCHLIEKYGLTSYGVDPTRKHRVFLKQLEENYNGLFKHVEMAVSSTNSSLIFYETQENESGSLLQDHQNIVHDKVISYEVETRNIKTLIVGLGLKEVSLIKIDIEGAEYALLEDINRDTFNGAKQVFIEFHHHAFKSFTRTHTRKIIDRMTKAGYKVFTCDGNNYLFYMPEIMKQG
jgi:FkbM family methyltransferase